MKSRARSQESHRACFARGRKREPGRTNCSARPRVVASTRSRARRRHGRLVSGGAGIARVASAAASKFGVIGTHVPDRRTLRHDLSLFPECGGLPRFSVGLSKWNSRCCLCGRKKNKEIEINNDSMKGDPGRELIVFTEALKVPVQELAAFLERACAGDENLRHKVEALLRAHERLGSFLEQPTIAATRVSSRKVATHASPWPKAQRRGHRKAKTSFQLRLRKRNRE